MATVRRPAGGGAVRIVLVAVVALIAVALVQRALIDSPSMVSPAKSGPAWGPASYDEALESLDRDVAREAARVEADPTQWARLEGFAMVLHARGQLTGSHDDLAAALAAGERAREIGPQGAGPVLSRAVVNLSMHRNAIAAEEAGHVERFAIATSGDLAEAQSILGDVALYSGEYDEALRHYRAAQDLAPGAGLSVRLADWHRHMGDFAKAKALLEEGLAKGPAPWMEATYLLQIGSIELQSGDWEAAEETFARADAAFPGWWLAQAHVAQMAAVRGDLRQAEALYRRALRGGERPSVMEALAAVLHERGLASEAAALERRAGALWAQYVSTHPEAYADHAFDAALRAGNTGRAWQLAAFNYRARPYGDGRIGLARAAAARGRDASARAILQELEKTGWRSVEQYRVLAEVCGRLSDVDCEADAREKALAVTPHAFDDRAGLLFFGNH